MPVATSHLKRLGWVGGARAKPVTAAPNCCKPQGQPTAFETGVAGWENALARPEYRVHCHTFQEPDPLAHSSSKRTLSRKVSMGCQKPSCVYAINSPLLAKASNGVLSQMV